MDTDNPANSTKTTVAKILALYHEGRLTEKEALQRLPMSLTINGAVHYLTTGYVDHGKTRPT